MEEHATKLIKYLREKGFTLQYVEARNVKNWGGQGFYNKGYSVWDFYRLTTNINTYTLEVKITGKPAYRLFNGNSLIALAFSQTELIRYFTNNKDMYGNQLYTAGGYT